MGDVMLFRFTRLWVALGLVAGLWALSVVRRVEPHALARPIGTPPGPVKILQFYANVSSLVTGEKALLCYGVENAKAVRIVPGMDGVYPALSRCVEIGPEHTTHYTIMAEGFDGRVTTRSFTLNVQGPVVPRRKLMNYADLNPVVKKSRIRAVTWSTAESAI